MKKLLLLFFWFTTSFYAQEDPSIASAKQVIQQATLHDSIICNSYITLLKHYKKNNEDSCKAYFQKLKTYAQKNNSNLAYFHYYKYKAGYYGLFLKEGEDSFEQIKSNLEQSLEYAQKHADPNLVAIAYSRLAQECLRFGFYDEALTYGKLGFEHTEQHHIWKEMAFILNVIGDIYQSGYNQTNVALQYLLKSDSIYQTHQYRGDEVGFVLSTIGDVYKNLGNNAEAEDYQNKAFQLFQSNNNEYQQKYILGKLASIERQKKNYPQAIAYLNDCIAYYREHKYPVKEAMFHIGLSEVYFDLGDKSLTLEKAQRAIDLSKEIDYDFGVLLALINKAKFLEQYGAYRESHALALEANALSDAMDSYIDKKDALELLYKTSEKLGNFKEAYAYSKEHKRVSDTLVHRQNLQQTKELEARYRNEKQEQEIVMLQAENKLVAAQKKNQRNWLLSIIGLSVLAMVVLFIVYRNRQITHRKLKELDRAKSTFFENITHEFRTPISLIQGPMEKRLMTEDLSETDRKEFEMIQRNSDRLLELINQLLDLSKLESNYYSIKVSQGNLSAFLNNLAASFTYKAELKNIKYIRSIPEITEAWFDQDALEKIVVNLLSNAFKYSAEGSTISFEVISKADSLTIQVENNGLSLSTEELDVIFKRFSRLKRQEGTGEAGSGIGLSLVKELVVLLHGQVKAENTTSNAVRFTVILPIAKSTFAAHEIVELPAAKEAQQGSTSEDVWNEEEKDGLPVLLIVEDNADIRTFIKDSFSNHFQVLEAADGASGMEQAIEQIPDIIISDLMMPVVSGIELCERLKQDERTSHIPIILLTAKSDEASQYQGLAHGADDYLLKPFSIKLLETRVNNLITSRLQLRRRYSKEVILKPMDLTINKPDEQFIEKVKAVLDDKITDDTFSIEEFSELLYMSRMQLHRKLKALTGLSASEFLRTERLKLAATLLEKNGVNINEICYEVGFNNPSYFAKCFKDLYGCSPSEYRSRQ